MSSKKRSIRFLKGAKQYRVSQEFSTLAIESFLQSIDCPRALTVWLLFKYGEHAQLANLGIDPMLYSNAKSFADAYVATSFLSKFKGLTLGSDKEAAAYEKFEKFEQLCRSTNMCFRNLGAHPLFKGEAVWLHNAIKQKISWILGTFGFEEFFSMPDWGPGASTLIKRVEASSPIKFQCETGITRDLHTFISPLLKAMYPSWGIHLEQNGFPQFQVGNKVITVPKSAAIDRVIAVEPGINIWFQLSVGKMIRNRLRRVGINLRDQSCNQILAKIGSVNQSLTTVDLSSASDSIAKEVARELLPDSWFNVMDVLRSHYGNVKGAQVRWEKFSSMGNGFTFPLESLIFYAIAKACAEYVGYDGNVGTYGDDVIIPTSAFALFSRMMDFYGFVINRTKSHSDSLFRESCGAHYFAGVDVKPLYLKDNLKDISSVYSFANAVRLYAFRQGGKLCCDARFRSTFELLVSKVPKALRLRVPEHFGDVGFISNFDEATPKCCGRGFEGYQAIGLMKTRKGRIFEELGLLLSQLWRLSKRDRPVLDDDDTDNQWKHWLVEPSVPEAIGEILKFEAVKGEKNSIPGEGLDLELIKGTVIQWPNLGPWLDLC